MINICNMIEDEFDMIGEELRKETLKMKRAQRRMKTWTTKYKNAKQNCLELNRKLNKLAENKVKSLGNG